jgi:hypothetical protein
MNNTSQRILEKAINRLNEVLPPGEELPNDLKTPIMGEGSPLDSMGFVNFLVALEEELESQAGVKTVLADHVSAGPGVRTMADMEKIISELVSQKSR